MHDFLKTLKQKLVRFYQCEVKTFNKILGIKYRQL